MKGENEMKKIMLIALLVALLSGCAATHDKSARMDWLRAHPDTPIPAFAAIMHGSIIEGMTKEQVQASWGRPCGYCYGTTSSSWGDTWEYNPFGSAPMGAGSGTIVYFGSRGRVIGWSGP